MLIRLRDLARLVVLALAVCGASAVDAGLVVTTDPDGATWPEPDTGNVIAAGPAVIETIPDDPPNGLFNNEELNSVELGGNRVASQIFTPTEGFRLGSIVMLGDGFGTYDDVTQQHIPMSIHLYELATTSAGAANLPASYNLSMAGEGDVAATDLFGGGAGLTFEYEGAPPLEYQFVGLNLTDSDRVMLEAGKTYVFEVRGNELLSAFRPLRTTGSWPDPNPYEGGDAYFSNDNDVAVDRSQFDSASRNLWMAIYPGEDPQTPMQDGDFNGDGNVDGADFVIWQTNFPNNSGGATLDMGDANGDGNVDGADFVVWQTNFPTTASSIAPVPEPSACLLAALALPVSLAIRRKLNVRR